MALLPRIFRLCRHSFHIFSWGSVAIFFSKKRSDHISLQRAEFCYFWSLKNTRKSTFIFVDRVRSSVSVIFTSDRSSFSPFFTNLQLGKRGLFLFQKPQIVRLSRHYFMGKHGLFLSSFFPLLLHEERQMVAYHQAWPWSILFELLKIFPAMVIMNLPTAEKEVAVAHRVLICGGAII